MITFGEVIKKRLGMDDNFSFHPGFVMNFGDEYQQRLHLDVNVITKKEWILHGPLCQEGMWLHIVVHQKGRKNTQLFPRKIHIPFGNYLLICSDVVHSGFLGIAVLKCWRHFHF